MTELQTIELKVLQLVGSINLKPTLERAADLGEWLAKAKETVPHGRWLQWLRRVGLKQRSAHNYMTVFRSIGNQHLPATMTIERFLRVIRLGKRTEKEKDREKKRAEVAAVVGSVPDSISLIRADCKKHSWPTLDAVVSDPPWSDMGCYRWLATMAAEKLRDSGLLLLQCGTKFLPEVCGLMAAVGLSYQWTLTLVHGNAVQASAFGAFRSCWKPMLVYTKGKAEFKEGGVSDTYTLRHSPQTLHEWQQPVEPLNYWLSRLVRAGSLVGDPFAGSGTVGVACHGLALRYVGTEIDAARFKVARGRLAALTKTPPVPDRGVKS